MRAATLGNDRVLTTEGESALAGEAVAALQGPDGVLLIDNGDTDAVPLPPELGRILQHVLDAMARGGTVTVTSIPEELTTTTAASILHMSRPTLMGLIRSGELPAHKVGSHHRLIAADVFAYQRARRARERAAFEALRELDDSDT